MADWEAMDEAEAKVDQLVSQNVDLDIINESGDAVLHVLASVGDKHGTELLIRKGANVNVHQQRSGITPLHIAAFLEHAELVQTLIELGADVNARNNHEHTPLHLLTFFGSGSNESLDTLELLLKHGGPESLLICDKDGDTALHCAAANSDPRLMGELLKFMSTNSVSSGGFEPTPTTSSTILPVINLPDHKGQTPLHHIAVGETSSNIENAGLLLNVAGALVHARNAGGATPFHYAVGRCNLEAASLLVEAGANKSIRDLYGATAFHYAARCGSVDLLGMLKEGNVDDRATENQLTALHYAAWNKRNEAVEWLLKNGASVDVIDALKGDTPLHLAARRGDADVIQTLIMGGANTQRTNKKGMLALGLADDRGHHGAAKAFVKAIREQNRLDWFQDSLLTKHSGNGATLLHYFAAYGAKEDMEWILKMIKRKTTSFHINKLISDGRCVHQRGVHMRDASNRTAVHWAAMRGNTHTLQVLAKNDADLNANANIDAHAENPLAQTPLYFALIMDQKETFANELMQLKPKHPTLQQDWISDILRWMKEYYHEDARSEKLQTLREGFKKHKYPSNISDDVLFEEIPPIYLALHAERDDLATFIQQHRKGEDDAVNERGWHSGRTALHWAVLLKQRKIVAQLCRKGFKDVLVANVEDKCRKTALQYAKEMGGSKNAQNEVYKDIEKELMQRSDVGSHIDGLYKDRQVYVDAANAILVGAALIAGVTFAGWLQPPLGYASYYNLPKASDAPAADNVYQTYAAIQHHGGVRWFWVSNALSFSFAIATVVAGLVAVVPIPGVYIATAVAHLRRCLLIAAALLGISIVFVLVAFAAAGFAVLPPVFKYQALMLGATIVGALPCLLLLAWFWRRLASLLPPWLFTMDVKTMWARICACATNTCRFCHDTRGADSNMPLKDAAIQVTVDSLPSNGNTKSPSPAREKSTAEDDEDYKLGEKYDVFPWLDGLSVASNVTPTASTS